MRLILIRHGKAENATADMTDSQRPLSRDGRQRLNNAYPTLAHYLRHLPRCQVWTSPKLRALQSAQILCRYMPDVEPIVHDFIADGSPSALSRALSSCSNKDTIVIFGHEPHLSNWVHEMSGLDYSFKKGRAVILYLKPNAPHKAICIGRLGFDQMNDLRQYLLPIDLAMSQLFRNQHRRIIAERDAFLEQADDSTILHQMRIQLRTQLALLDFVKPLCREAVWNAAVTNYIERYQELESLRRIDVIMESIHSSHNWQLEPLARAMEIDRNHEMLQLEDRFSQPVVEEAYHECLSTALEAMSTFDNPTKLHSFVSEQFAKRYKDVRRRAKKCDISDLDSLLALRAECMTLRYIFEFFAPLVDETIARQYQSVRRLDRYIGLYRHAIYNLQLLDSQFKDSHEPGITLALTTFHELQNQYMNQIRTTILDTLENMPKSPKD